MPPRQTVYPVGIRMPTYSLTDVTQRTIVFRHCSPDGAACGAIRVCPRSPGLRRKRLHPGYGLRGCVTSVLNSTVLPPAPLPQGEGGERLWDHDKCAPNYNHNTPVILRRHFRNFHNRTFVWQPICLKPNFSLLFRKMFQP